MSETILTALITGGVSLVGTILTVILTNQKTQNEMDKKIAVIETKVDGMKEDIRSHNTYAQMFQENIPSIKQHMTDIDRRLENLERK